MWFQNGNIVAHVAVWQDFAGVGPLSGCTSGPYPLIASLLGSCAVLGG